MVTYVCMFCEYRWDSEKGDLEYKIAPGTKLEDLPDDWVCPQCSQGKSAFIIDEEE